MQFDRTTLNDIGWTLAALALVLAWDAGGLDLALARPLADAHGFFLQDDWFLSNVMHVGARRAAWLPALWLVVGIWLPTGIQRRLERGERVHWAASTLLALAAISVLKQFSHTSCPWDLLPFGGHTAWVSHWSLASDQGPGRCFPAGHASAGFAFLSGYFVLRAKFPRQAALWLGGALLAGFLFGLAQQLRGAHFMSHTLWTGWVCWTVGVLCAAVARVFVPKDRSGLAPAQASAK